MQSSGNGHVAAAPIVADLSWIKIQRDPQLRFRRRIAKISSHHTDDLTAQALQEDRTSDDVRVAPISLFPEGMA